MEQKDRTQENSQDKKLCETDYINTKPTLIIDYELYEHFLDDCDLSDEEKQNIIEALWIIITSFASLGFGVHPLQQILENECGHLEDTCNQSTQIQSNEVNLKDQQTHERNPKNKKSIVDAAE